ncbi:Ser-Thr-rich glycosyl-phosphatidyl-inositol-anchored membrane family-domain-containing protein [Daldinia vernicosa]|uniref:Ser-Thr-rich glycosyl-phosphatidyl-inositol-anchored membrane family-domain-containing protein n=1 Tax=Daldinia vernicosa TaxID=114800 RepID=UPI0020087759|nr:Ser-Thr-rich glycosyl-phosphatidyl-inositol-anchored membrane family-domain-containing protein [Daldinia vernicosa]KAI0852468.1 Ser-Thr-rich glycosyl-phosphatidyl-inositol-anchored membrane family-domain-containing protein [Daldinia vernicosa]
MRSTTAFASALAFAASAFAQTPGYAVLTSPAEGQQVASGQTFTIKWQPGSYTGAATITLLGGETSTTLLPGPVLATVEVSEGTFSWTVDCSLGTDKTYGIKIASVADSATFQYSFPFAIAGPSCSTGAESSSASVASVASSSSAGGYPTEGYPTQGYPTLSSSSVISSASSPASSSAPPSYPTATVSSSSVIVTSSIVTSSSSVVVSNATSASSTKVPTYPTVVPSGNLSTTAKVPTYVPTTVITSSGYASVTSAPSATTSAATTIPTAGASNVAAGSLALVGGLAFALFGM